MASLATQFLLRVLQADARRAARLGLTLHPENEGDLTVIAHRVCLTMAGGGEAGLAMAWDVLEQVHRGWPRDPRWWRSDPVGSLVAWNLAEAQTIQPETLTYQEAADVLGVARGTVATLVSRGTLDSVPGQGVKTQAVLARLTRGMDPYMAVGEMPSTHLIAHAQDGSILIAEHSNQADDYGYQLLDLEVFEADTSTPEAVRTALGQQGYVVISDHEHPVPGVTTFRVRR